MTRAGPLPWCIPGKVTKVTLQPGSFLEFFKDIKKRWVSPKGGKATLICEDTPGHRRVYLLYQTGHQDRTISP